MATGYAKRPAPHPTAAVQLLLHTSDGVVPYLTPTQLQQNFSPDVFPQLHLAWSVRETCVGPIFANSQRGISRLNGDLTTKKNNPQGYTFTPRARDAWLWPYPIVVVPTFDHEDDAAVHANRGRQPNASRLGKEVHLWTSNGRIKLTPSLYADCCIAKDCKATQAPVAGLVAALALFDHWQLPAAMNDQKQKARIEFAQDRWQEWTRHLQECVSDTDVAVWAPVTVQGNIAEQLQHYINRDSRISHNSKAINAFVLVDWHVHDETDTEHHACRAAHLEQAMSALPSTANLGVLCTPTLSHFFDALTAGVDIIGTDLPQRWSKQHIVLVLDDVEQLLALANGRSHKRGKTRSSVREPGSDQNRAKSSIAWSDYLVELRPPPTLTTSSKTPVDQHAWYRDTAPLRVGCTCTTCHVHSRAYVYHLVCAQELLAENLLMVHNLHALLHLVQHVGDGANARR